MTINKSQHKWILHYLIILPFDTSSAIIKSHIELLFLQFSDSSTTH